MYLAPVLRIPLQSLLCAIRQIFIMDIMKLLFKGTEKLVNKYHFCLVEINRKGQKENVCPGVFAAMKDGALILCLAQIVQFAFCMTLFD